MNTQNDRQVLPQVGPGLALEDAAQCLAWPRPTSPFTEHRVCASETDAQHTGSSVEPLGAV